MLITHGMTHNPFSLQSNAVLGEAAALMTRHKFRHVPIVEGEALLGIVSKGDLQRAVPADVNPFSPGAAGLPVMQRPIRQFMTPQPTTVQPDEPMEHAAQILIERKFGALPVTQNGRLVGIISETDVLRAFVATFGSGIRITFDVPDQEDVIAFALHWSQSHNMRLLSVHTFAHDGRAAAVVNVQGKESPQLVESLWSSGHKVISVVRGE